MRPTLIYDGDCAFCTACVRFARRWVDRTQRFIAMPWQHLNLADFGLTAADCSEAVWFVTPDETRYRGHLAVAAALRSGGIGWRPLGYLLAAPGISPIAARVYARVAANRHRLPGSTAACAVTPAPGPPAPE